MANRRESIAGVKIETNSFFVNVCAINFPKSPAGICFATAADSSLPFDSDYCLTLASRKALLNDQSPKAAAANQATSRMKNAHSSIRYARTARSPEPRAINIR